jgi:hypothetical protein
MATTTKSKTITTSWGTEIDEASLPPMEPFVLAAYRRMWTDPDVFAGYEPETWVAFAGEQIIAASTDLAELHRILDEMGERDVLLAQVDPIGLHGHRE